MTRRILVCGGRDFADKGRVERFLNTVVYLEPVVIIQGGADALAASWARTNKACPHEPETFKADWKNVERPGALIKHGRYGPYDALAGFVRNQRMIDEGRPDLVVAFPGGSGTADMVKRAHVAGVRVVRG